MKHFYVEFDIQIFSTKLLEKKGQKDKKKYKLNSEFWSYIKII